MAVASALASRTRSMMRRVLRARCAGGTRSARAGRRSRRPRARRSPRRACPPCRSRPAGWRAPRAPRPGARAAAPGAGARAAGPPGSGRARRAWPSRSACSRTCLVCSTVMSDCSVSILLREGADLGGQHALAALLLLDLRALAVDLPLQRVAALAARAERQHGPQGERQRRHQEQEAESTTHAAGHARRPPPAVPAHRPSLWSVQRILRDVITALVRACEYE